VDNGRLIVLFSLMIVLFPARMAFAIDAGVVQVAPSGETQTTSGQGGQKIIVEKKNGLAEMREWLNQRNVDRQQKTTGLTEGFNRVKKKSALFKPRPSRVQEHPKSGLQAGGDAPQLSQGLAGQQTGRGPDGRIRHRLLINEDGPDQLQVYSGSGYAAPNDTGEDAEKLAHLTPRGKQAWRAGSYLRVPASYLSLKPKGWNHPKYGNK